MKKPIFLFLVVAFAMLARSDRQPPVPELLFMNSVLYNILGDTDLERKDVLSQESLDFLYNEIVTNLGKNLTTEACSKTYEYVCGDNAEFKEIDKMPTTELLSVIQRSAKEILREEPNNHELKSLSIEKQLYRDCMRFDSQFGVGSKNIVEYAFQNLIDNVSSKPWNVIDDELESLGFGYGFFDITVVDDPEDVYKKIIFVEPSLPIKLYTPENMVKFMKALKVENKDFSDVISFITVLDNVLNLHLNEGISTFKRVPIGDWYKSMLDTGNLETSSKIHWSKIFHKVLTREDLSTQDVSHVLANQQYFEVIQVLLMEYSARPSVIAQFLALKWIYNNMKFVSWDSWTGTDENQMKSSFCLHQTKLYGTSYEILRIINSDKQMGPLVKKAQEIMQHIVNMYNVDIIISKNMSKSLKNIFRSYLKDITTVLLRGQSDGTFIDSFYGDFNVTHNYSKDIRNYRKLVQARLHSWKLTSKSATSIEPFSIIDIEKPQNRLVLKAYLKSYELVSATLPKEYHYGYYGAAMSRFLYDLLNNKIYHRPEKNTNEIDWLYTEAYHPVKKCIDKSTSIFENLDNTISEVYGLRNSYDAMLQHFLRDEIVRKPFSFKRNDSEIEIYSSDAIFTYSYVKAGCDQRLNFAENILLNFEPFQSALNCPVYDYSKCDMSTFLA